MIHYVATISTYQYSVQDHLLCRQAQGYPWPPAVKSMHIRENKGLITLCVVSLAFLFHLAFFILPRILPRVFPRVLDTNMLVSKMRVETQENGKKNARKIQNASPTRENVSILHYALGKNTSQFCFGRVLVAFWSRFGRVLVINLTKTQTQCIV